MAKARASSELFVPNVLFCRTGGRCLAGTCVTSGGKVFDDGLIVRKHEADLAVVGPFDEVRRPAIVSVYFNDPAVANRCARGKPSDNEPVAYSCLHR